MVRVVGDAVPVRRHAAEHRQVRRKSNTRRDALRRPAVRAGLPQRVDVRRTRFSQSIRAAAVEHDKDDFARGGSHRCWVLAWCCEIVAPIVAQMRRRGDGSQV